MLGKTTTHLNLIDTARAAGTFTTFIAAVEQAGFELTLADEGPFTVFAPHDEAFAELPEGAIDSLLAAPDTLTSVVTYHLVPGLLPAAEAAYVRRAQTLQGEMLRLSLGSEIHVDGARLVTPDIQATNGLIHTIDRVLLPAQI